MNEAREMLRKLLAGDKILIAPGAHNGVAARIIKRIGFQAIYATGYGASASQLGQADVGLMTMTEMVNHMANIVNATILPVIADGDTGYGNVINVIRTVQLYEQAGVAAIQLEDQVMPKKCGHMLGREIVPMEEMVGKIEAAANTRRDDDFVIIARTDARTKYGIDEAIKRGKAYANAGADVIFIESPESIDEMKFINETIQKPTLANMVERGRTPLLPASELEQIGYKIAIYPVASVLAEAYAVNKVYKGLMETGSTNGFVDCLYGFEEFNDLMGANVVKAIEKRYLQKV